LLRGFHMAIMSSDQLVIIPALTAGPFAESFKCEARRIVLGDSCYERFLDDFGCIRRQTNFLLEASETEVAQSRIHILAFDAGL
jgi:hypothetical protein